MKLEGILSISGKPGLYKLVSQAKNTLIVESLTDSKRLPLYASHQVSALEDIGIYTYDDTLALSDVFSAIAKKENGEWIIMELGDGQVSGLPDNADTDIFYYNLKENAL